MSGIASAGLTILILVMFAGLFSTVSGFPGTLVILAAAVVYSIVTGFSIIGLKVIGALLLIAVLAESLDAVFIMYGAKRFGFTKKGLLVSFMGSLAGALVLTPAFMGMGAIAGILIGGLTAKVFMEIVGQKGLKPSARASYGEILGAAAGNLLKGSCGVLMVIIVLIVIYS